jgi:hypothetical protein
MSQKTKAKWCVVFIVHPCKQNTVDWSSVMKWLSLPKKLVRHGVGVRLSFSYDTFDIERMVGDNSGFLGSDPGEWHDWHTPDTGVKHVS